MFEDNTVTMLISTTVPLTVSDSANLSDATEYRQIIGNLQDLAFTHPDIAYAVNKLSQFMHKPTSNH